MSADEQSTGLRRRTGKIAKLPKEQRDLVNRMMRDGRDYADIIVELEKAGITGLFEQNLTNWNQGGYQDWLRDQDRMEEIKFRANASLDLVRGLKESGDVHITEANELILASHINEALSEFDPAGLKIALAESPVAFLKLAVAVTSQSAERTKRVKLELEFTKYQDKVAEQKQKMEAALSQAKTGGLQPDTLARIEEALKLL